MGDINKRILVVDDEKPIRDFFKILLSSSNLEVSEAEDGYTAIKLARESKFNVFFIDMRMPGLDGLETSRKIHQISPEAVITIMTGFSMSEAVKVAQQEGCKVIDKPFDINLVEEIIKSAK